MEISVFGLGYVGTVSLGILGDAGHNVIGVDINRDKVAKINKGEPPIHEPKLGELIRNGFASGRIKASTDTYSAVKETDVSFITVGTPTDSKGNVELESIKKVVEDISEPISHKDDYHLIVMRSTVPPGTSKECINLVSKITGKRPGKDFGWVVNPEFLREGSAVKDFLNPPFRIIGEYDKESGKKLKKVYSSFTPDEGSTFRLDIKEAEVFKYINNAFHALKVTFANEVGRICDNLDISAQNVMKVFKNDKKLNLSSYYLTPGLPYGGSCLPKDTRGLSKLAKDLNTNTPIFNSIERSNKRHIQFAVKKIEKIGIREIGFIGITFKHNTNDVRESPFIYIMKHFLEEDYNVSFFDSNIDRGNIMGQNLSFLQCELPKWSTIQVESLRELMDNSKLIIVGNTNFSKEEIADASNSFNHVINANSFIK